jgi:anti-sigma B factor antagonist
VPATISSDERPGAWVLTARGELDYADCAAFRSHVDRILRAMPPACIVDLSEIDYLDSSGLGLLLSLYREYGTAGGKLVLIASETVDGILDITRLDTLFATAEDVESALAAL